MGNRGTKMNGKPFTHFTYCDFGTPGRRDQVGRHTSLEAARGAYKRLFSYWGNTWIEEGSGIGCKKFSMLKVEEWWNENGNKIPKYLRPQMYDMAMKASSTGRVQKDAIRSIVAALQAYQEELTQAVEAIEETL